MIKQTLRKTYLKVCEYQNRRRLFSVKLEKSDIAIDCGANVGEITKYLAKTGATVYAFEPNSYAFRVLKSRFQKCLNVNCIKKGVSDKSGKMKLFLHKNSDNDEVLWSTGSSFLEYKRNILSEKYEEVEVVDLCEFIESLNQRVRILKLDVEGVECKILEKLINSGTIDKIDYAFVETHDHKIPELKTQTEAIRNLIKKKRITNIDLNWT